MLENNKNKNSNNKIQLLNLRYLIDYLSKMKLIKYKKNKEVN